jgi:DNA (cytosine-5)-methyltransferase 1
MLTSLEICAGAGGQALGLEQAGFNHAAAIEIDAHAWRTLRSNRPEWNPLCCDIRQVDPRHYKGIDLIAGGVPCPPFSVAGRQLGQADERDLFPVALDLIESAKPAAVMIENVKGLASRRFAEYRSVILERMRRAGYAADWQLLNAADFGVPQLRPRFILVALRQRFAAGFRWPEPDGEPPSVGEALRDLMSSHGWLGAARWAAQAKSVAPTLVGGSKKHGGPDLGPTRAKAQWRLLRVDAMGVANEPPDAHFPRDGSPRLTVRMAARLQGFPDWWEFSGGKTAAYRQVGNAFPPPVAKAVGRAIASALGGESAIGLPPLGSILFQTKTA